MSVIAPPLPRQEQTAPPKFLTRLAHSVLRHRRRVIAIWFVILVAGGASASHVAGRLNVDFSLPGQPGYETAVKVLSIYHSGGENPPSIAVVTVAPGQTVRGDLAKIGAAFATVRGDQPDLRVVDYGITHDSRFITSDDRTTFALVFEPPAKTFGTDKLAAAAQSEIAEALPGSTVTMTGLNQLAAGSSSSTGPGVLVETMIGALGALAVLAFVFASFLALIPLLIAAVSILSTFLVILGLTYVTDVSFIVQFLVALVGLGIAIDYSLLLVTRWREERAKGATNDEAVVTAVETAGRAVTLSGVTVAIGLLSLIVLPVPGLRSTGIGGMLIPLVSILVVNTLLPAILGGIGPRIDWPRIRHEDHASRAWSRWARLVTHHRVPVTAIALGILVVAFLPILHLKVGETSSSAFAQTGPAHAAFATLERGGVPDGVLTPIEILTTASAGPSTARELAATPGVASVVLPTGITGTRSGDADIIAIPEVETVNNTTLASVRAVQAKVHDQTGVIGVTGTGAVQQDYSRAVFGNFPLMFAVIAVLTFLLLARAFRSIVLAAKAVILNLISLGATFGLLTWFWQDGHGSHLVFNIPATGAITFWVPLMVFAFLFGLSMDYEVFILTRIREEYDRGGDTRHAIVEGLGRTGRLVTSAALILFLAFASLASAPDTDIKVLATGLGAGILLDATVIRAALVPALIDLFGRWNWWMPARLGRLLRVGPPAGNLAGGEPQGR